MRAIVLRDFPYSNDGIHVETLAKGVIFECRSDLWAGLLAEKYIAPAPEEVIPTLENDPQPATNELPADVQALVMAADEAEARAAKAREEAKSKPKGEKSAAFEAVKALDEAAAAARAAADKALAAVSAG